MHMNVSAYTGVLYLVSVYAFSIGMTEDEKNRFLNQAIAFSFIELLVEYIDIYI